MAVVVVDTEEVEVAVIPVVPPVLVDVGLKVAILVNEAIGEKVEVEVCL